MGFATVAATLVSIMLIIMTLYIFLMSTFEMSDTISLSLKKMSDSEEDRIKTRIDIGTITKSEPILYVNVLNTGSTIIREFSNMDVIVTNTTNGNVYWLKYTMSGFGWSQTITAPDFVNPGYLDPDETMQIKINMSTYDFPDWVKIITPNGVSSSKYV